MGQTQTAQILVQWCPVMALGYSWNHFLCEDYLCKCFSSMSNTPKKTTVISWTNFLHTYMFHQKQVYNFPPSCSALWASLTCFQLGCASPRTSKLPKNTFCVTLTQHVHVVNHHRFRAHVICWKEQTGDVRDSHHRLLLLHPILTALLYRSSSPWLWLLQLLIQFKIKGHHFGTS